MPPKPILCTCGKRFKNNDAMHQHQRASSFHVDAPHLAERQLPLDNLVQRLSLQDQEADHGFILFLGGGRSTFFVRNPDIRISSWSEAAAPVSASEQATAGGEGVSSGEGTKEKKKKKKKGRGNTLKMDRDGDSGWKVNANTGQMMDLTEDQNWGLCDKDCGWCGHCTDGVFY